MGHLRLKICIVESCQKQMLAKGLCRAHYDQVRKGAQPGPPRKTPRRFDVDEAYGFIARALASGVQECIDWPWSRKPKEYPVISHADTVVRVHRYVCELANGQPPFEGAEAAHNCGRPCCVNPNHIRWSTHQDNARDMTEHGTVGKLNPAKVMLARKSVSRGSQKYLAEKFGVSVSALSNARTGKTWVRVPGAVKKRA